MDEHDALRALIGDVIRDMLAIGAMLRAAGAIAEADVVDGRAKAPDGYYLCPYTRYYISPHMHQGNQLKH